MKRQQLTLNLIKLINHTSWRTIIPRISADVGGRGTNGEGDHQSRGLTAKILQMQEIEFPLYLLKII